MGDDIRLVDVDQEDCELVAAKPGDDILGPYKIVEPPAHLDEYGIAGCVAVRVVHRFEAVEIDEQEGVVLR